MWKRLKKSGGNANCRNFQNIVKSSNYLGSLGVAECGPALHGEIL